MRRTILRTALFSLVAMNLPYSVAYSENAPAQEKTQEAKPEISVKNAHAVSLHGSPKYAEDFKHLGYVNPDAPKGGTLKQHEVGTFDSLNPFIIKGVPAAGMNYIRSGLVYESLMQNAWDEPFTLYGVIAKDITIADDKSWVRFTLREEAKWHDGTPITADDVIWTFQTLTEKGQPFFKAYWHDIEEITSDNAKSVTFKFTVKGNAELPLIIAEMSVLPKHYWTVEGREFNETSLDAPLGSGPYKVGKVDAGRSIEFVRNPDWWGKDLPFFKGMYNFDHIVFDYYLDENVAHEAFLSGDFDIKQENKAKTWQEEYDVSADKAQSLIMEELEHKRPAGMQALVYNIRRPAFQDILVREALAYAYDFEWSNKQFAYGDYVRGQSYYDNSELASSATLPSEAELAILTPVKDKIPARVFTEIYKAPHTDGSGNARNNLRQAKKLLEQAGYTQLNDKDVRYKTLDNGDIQELKFEILYHSMAYERWILPFVKNLKRLGVEANFRVVDTAQFQNRANTFDYDILIGGFGQSNSPGNEQREFWSSAKADVTGSRNYIGIKNPVIDDMIDGIIGATSRDDLVTKVRAMDRVLLWNHYVIPMWHYPKWRIAHWDNIKRPDTLSDISPLISYTWWSSEAEEQK
ncbi:MAG: extracellular solute-binding protein [Alphaproteobacteria bacterium]